FISSRSDTGASVFRSTVHTGRRGGREPTPSIPSGHRSVVGPAITLHPSSKIQHPGRAVVCRHLKAGGAGPHANIEPMPDTGKNEF
ncbi:MAG: hypothetical protein VYC25_10830, partial [Actinomycetota bacterium]|nr:hypothetical protein [Actinomycetota bacterium]